MASKQIVGQRGPDAVHNYADGDTKANFSFFALIYIDGTKLALTSIARGKAMRCHQQSGD
jgi:hypothetical protein